MQAFYVFISDKLNIHLTYSELGIKYFYRTYQKG
jgi:hypothetical protein